MSALRRVGVQAAIPYLAWAQALIATVGSLMASEVYGLQPCTLCWYQRILMYPLVLVIGVGILTRGRRLRLYVLPLSLLGLAVATYHNLLYYGVITESVTQCTTGVSCTARLIELFGFVTIPLLSLTAFAVISVLMAVARPGDPDD
ncbi:MAG: disulfide bond formation protein B [Chloroflexi bacterium]|nr:disulfide bond formation protein B [Chloroflexota bacterium]